MPENPFHRVFQFCKFNHKDPQVFFNIVFALSKDISLIEEDDLSNNKIWDMYLEEEVQKRSRYQYVCFIKENQKYNVRLEEKAKGNKNKGKMQRNRGETASLRYG